jgi:hypothetical protein
MADLLKNLVEETANNPGSGLPVSLLGALTNRTSFVQAFGNGGQCFYALTDGLQTEWGIGTVTAASPNVLSRDTVLGNTAGTTARLNFTGAVRVYNEAPAERLALTDIVSRGTLFGQASWGGNYNLTEAGLTIDGSRIVIPAGARKVEVSVIAYFQSASASSTVCNVVPQVFSGSGALAFNPSPASLPVTTISGVTGYAQVAAQEVFDPGAPLAAGYSLGATVYRNSVGAAVLYRIETRARFLMG